LARSARSAPVRAFSVVEVLVVIAILALLLALVFVGLSRSRSAAKSVECLANLHHIALGFQSYALENDARLPDPLLQATTWESMLRKYLRSTQVLRCPADEEVYPSLGSSYDWRDGGEPATSVAGRAIYACRPDAVLAFDALPGWHRKRMFNIVRVDGSAMSLDEQQCLADLRRSATTNDAAR
jgi:prepilin-type N-terminal cleavage/methylation domain-containing protein